MWTTSFKTSSWFLSSRNVTQHFFHSCWSGPMLGLCPNTCFARGGKGLSSGMLIIWTQTLTLAHDWWLMARGSWFVTAYHLHADAWMFTILTIITCFGMHAYWWQLCFNCWSIPDTSWCSQTLTWVTICSYSAQSINDQQRFFDGLLRDLHRPAPWSALNSLYV